LNNEFFIEFKLFFIIAGMEDYDRLRPLCYTTTDIFLVCYDVNEKKSKEKLIDFVIYYFIYFIYYQFSEIKIFNCLLFH